MPKRAVQSRPLSFDSPESKLIRRASYDELTQVLTVEFAAGTTYTYGHVPSDIWHDFEQASSVGAFFNQVIRPMFAGKQVE